MSLVSVSRPPRAYLVHLRWSLALTETGQLVNKGPWSTSQTPLWTFGIGLSHYSRHWPLSAAGDMGLSYSSFSFYWHRTRSILPCKNPQLTVYRSHILEIKMPNGKRACPWSFEITKPINFSVL